MIWHIKSVCPYDSLCLCAALKISGAKMKTQSRSQMKVPAKVKATSPMTFQRNSSLGKGDRWINSLSCGWNSQAAAATAPATVSTERNSASKLINSLNLS